MEAQAPGLVQKEEHPKLLHQSTQKRWSKVISFDVKGEAIYSDIQRRIMELVLNTYSIPYYSDDGYKLCMSLQTLDLSNYYLNSNGPKVTKLIRNVLKDLFGDKSFEDKFPLLCKKISELYLPQTKLLAFWGNKSMVGEGVWEGSTTCFSTTGCNAVSKEFVRRFDRIQVLVLAMKGVKKGEKIVGYNDVPCGCSDNSCTLVGKEPIWKTVETPTTLYTRCLVYFLGGRVIHLTNFYYQTGVPQNYRLHVEALRRLLGLRKVKFASYVDPNLPIYLNGDGVEVRCEERSKKYNGVRKFPCPHCSNIVPEHHFYHDTDDNSHFLGCSEECAGVLGIVTCSYCSSVVDEDDSSTINDDIICNSCRRRHFSYCESCQEYVHYDNYLGDDLCINCGTLCTECMEAFISDDMHDINGKHYCPNCYRERFMECTECREAVERRNTTDDLCPSCYQKKEEELEKREEATL